MGPPMVGQIAKSFLRLCYLGNPVLRRQALAVERSAISKPEFQNLIKEMQSMLSDETLNGIGLAAPQVQRSFRMFLYCPYVDNSDSEELDEFLPPIVMINPVIKSHCNDIINDWEQCLSIPGLTGLVPRWHSLSVDYLDADSQPQSTVLHGINARTVQHEIDHLDGRLFIDKVDCKKNLFMTQEYERMLDEQPEEILKREYPKADWPSFNIQHQQ